MLLMGLVWGHEMIVVTALVLFFLLANAEISTWADPRHIPSTGTVR